MVRQSLPAISKILGDVEGDGVGKMEKGNRTKGCKRNKLRIKK
jgi:hypothetical protein